MVSSEQEEELESLSYLYTEEELIVLNRDPVHIQVRVSSSVESGGSPIKALLDLEWGPQYPQEKPKIEVISMDLKQADKDSLVESLLKSCDDCIGMAMTFVLSSALSELLSTAHEDKLSKIKDTVASKPVEVKEEPAPVMRTSTVQEPKTKAQKRREQSNWQKAGELPRGYNWVDVLNHLRKTAND
ncbi:hypothetical protein WA538_005940 [Blastocystis sp. DL]